MKSLLGAGTHHANKRREGRRDVVCVGSHDVLSAAEQVWTGCARVCKLAGDERWRRRVSRIANGSPERQAGMGAETDQHLVCLHCYYAASTFNPRLLLWAPAPALPRYPPPVVLSYTLPLNRLYAPHAAPRRAGPSSTPVVCRRFTSTHPHTGPSRLQEHIDRSPSHFPVSCSRPCTLTYRVRLGSPQTTHLTPPKSLALRPDCTAADARATLANTADCRIDGLKRIHGRLRQSAGEGVRPPAEWPAHGSKGHGIRKHIRRQSRHGRPLADNDLAVADEDPRPCCHHVLADGGYDAARPTDAAAHQWL
jgi:hypothetical protein